LRINEDHYEENIHLYVNERRYHWISTAVIKTLDGCSKD
jgi:hypothetical protein